MTEQSEGPSVSIAPGQRDRLHVLTGVTEYLVPGVAAVGLFLTGTACDKGPVLTQDRETVDLNKLPPVPEAVKQQVGAVFGVTQPERPDFFANGVYVQPTDPEQQPFVMSVLPQKDSSAAYTVLNSGRGDAVPAIPLPWNAQDAPNSVVNMAVRPTDRKPAILASYPNELGRSNDAVYSIYFTPDDLQHPKIVSGRVFGRASDDDVLVAMEEDPTPATQAHPEQNGRIGAPLFNSDGQVIGLVESGKPDRLDKAEGTFGINIAAPGERAFGQENTNPNLVVAAVKPIPISRPRE
jgi:hypothetical protein